MNARTSILWMSLAALCTVIGLWAGQETKISAAASAPASLAGRTWALSESTNQSTMRFLSNSRYEKISSSGDFEAGYFTPRQISANVWQVATTTLDGSVTRQYTFDFTSSSGGTVVVLMAGSRVAGTFQDASVPSSGLATMNVTNEVSLSGPSFYKIDFSGGSTGTFKISLPGYGAGIFNYTPTPTSAKLVLTYTNADIAGDVDSLDLQFRASSGSSALSSHSGYQVIRGQTNPISGTFTFTVQ